ncbi:methyl-accepting chemotaxis protein [Methanospirillum stamsii]|uniref:Methyl-accepting chemotaxis protein n=2 Tax=Methanospirillum stamsii TaxID=1277351 RepID=A0A2V2N7Y6_9EURY|nr:methyl-accepting chemotaxis protein [Methanospirillum stamsii]
MEMLENVKIGKKLIGGFLLTIVIMLIIAGVGFVFISNLADKSDQMYQDRLLPIQYIGVINGAFTQFRGDAYKAMLIPEEREVSLASGDAALKLVDEQTLLIDKVNLNPEEREIFETFKTAYKGYYSESMKTIDFVKQNKIPEAIASLSAGTPLANYRAQCNTALTSLMETNLKVAEEIKAENDRNAETAKTSMIIVTIIGAIVGIGFAYALTRSITGPLSKTVEMIEEMNHGHLGMRLGMTRKDEIGELSGTMDNFANNLQNEVIGIMKKIAGGEKVSSIPIMDERDEIGPALKLTAETINSLIDETKTLANGAAEGDLNIRGDADQFKGGYRDIIAGINTTLDNIIGPVNEAMNLAGAYALGDFSARFSTNVTVKGDFIPFRDSLNKIGIETGQAIGQVKKEVDSLLAGMEETSASVEEVTAGAQNLAHNASVVSDLSEKSGEGVSQVLQAMSDLSVTVGSVAGQANEVANLTQETDNLSREGSSLVGRVEKGMQKISGSVNETDQVVGEIGKQMEDIGTIVNVISSIADQTNLLALNAAIEAARAGDAGLGFAVVADEVKSLALESQKSAEKIATLISDLQRKSKAVTESMKTSLVDVEEGNVAVRETLTVFNKIAEAIGTVSIRVGEVAGASEEQAASVEEVTASVNELGDLIEQAAKEAVDSSAATEEASAALDQITRVITDSTASIDRISQSMGRFSTQ